MMRFILFFILILHSCVSDNQHRTGAIQRSTVQHSFMWPRLELSIQELSLKRSNLISGNAEQQYYGEACRHSMMLLQKYDEGLLALPERAPATMGKITFVSQIHLKSGQTDRDKALRCQQALKDYFAAHTYAVYIAEGFDTEGQLATPAVMAHCHSQWQVIRRSAINLQPASELEYLTNKFTRMQAAAVEWYWPVLESGGMVVASDQEPLVLCVEELEIRRLAYDRFFGTMVNAYQAALRGVDVAVVWGASHETDYRWFMQNIAAEPIVIKVDPSCTNEGK